MGDLQKLIRALIYVPGVHAQEVVVRRLTQQIPTLKADAWIVTVTKTVKTGAEGKKEETLVRILMEWLGVEAVRALDSRPFCRVGRAYTVFPSEKTEEEVESSPHNQAMEVEATPIDGVSEAAERDV